jgi:chromate transporter
MRTAAVAEVLGASLRLGLTSFGGPIAHLGYFERIYVRERRWLGGGEYASLVGLCQLLPGPTSSQVGFLIGYHRAGWFGAVAAWVGFTLPSALFMYLFAVFAPALHGPATRAVFHGLMLAAAAVVAQAVWSMARSSCPDWPRRGIAALAAVLLVLDSAVEVQFAALLLGAMWGWALCRDVSPPAQPSSSPVNLRVAWGALVIFGVLLLTSTALAAIAPHGPIALANIFYRVGAVVFGGGHVVLPLLREGLVPQGWLSDDAFLAGYGFAQCMPGPLFAVATYLGAVSAPHHVSALWATIALLAIFVPGLLLAIAGLSALRRLTQMNAVTAMLSGVNASVVGVLGAALYNPVWTNAVHTGVDAAVAAVGFVLLERWRMAPIIVVALCVLGAVVTG